MLENATVVTGVPGADVIPDGAVFLDDGVVVSIGPRGTLRSPDTATRIDAGGGIVMPGLVNAHSHAADGLFRGLVEDLPLEPWLQTVWKAEGAILNADTVRLGARLGLAEMLLSGITATLDMFWYPFSTAKAAEELGIRLVGGGVFIDGKTSDGLDHRGHLAESEKFILGYRDHPHIHAAVQPHGTYTVGPSSLKDTGELARRHGVLWGTHAAETAFEQATVTKRHGRSVIRHLSDLGLLGPDVTLAHCVHLDEEEIALLASTGTNVAHNPVSNLKLGSGISPVPDMLAAGVNVALGTDGPISGNDLDPWLAMRLAAILHKGARQDATAVPAETAFWMATANGARALGLADRIGTLEPGKAADLILVDTGGAHATPMFDPVNFLVFAAGRGDVRDVFVGGEPVVRNRRLARADLAAIKRDVAALVPDIRASIGR
nr:amidohydrolase [Chthonobacter albigriseus]